MALFRDSIPGFGVVIDPARFSGGGRAFNIGCRRRAGSIWSISFATGALRLKFVVGGCKPWTPIGEASSDWLSGPFRRRFARADESWSSVSGCPFSPMIMGGTGLSTASCWMPFGFVKTLKMLLWTIGDPVWGPGPRPAAESDVREPSKSPAMNVLEAPDVKNSLEELCGEIECG